ncbi:hypothetical protein VNO80_16643 [Phaseolus coccineus]|uniref:non-specific serine/threonine protein kinase n=1 Tax=Phaseolus coccineus TaxID=3886 RepID=A0AAN9MS30_PHACN
MHRKPLTISWNCTITQRTSGIESAIRSKLFSILQINNLRSSSTIFAGQTALVHEQKLTHRGGLQWCGRSEICKLGMSSAGLLQQRSFEHQATCISMANCKGDHRGKNWNGKRLGIGVAGFENIGKVEMLPGKRQLLSLKPTTPSFHGNAWLSCSFYCYPLSSTFSNAICMLHIPLNKPNPSFILTSPTVFMALPFSLVLCYLVLFLLRFLHATADQNNDKLHLLSFKEGLQNPHVLPSWHSATPHCDWVGVTCQLGRVTSLTLPNRNLRGTLSSSLFSLSSLSLLNLRENQLTGEIPGELGGLLQLETLRLGSNLLTGNIPPEVGLLRKLCTLDLSGNSLVGEVPDSVGNLTRLEFLDLSNNFLSGSLPVSLFSGARSLISVDISNNSFSGVIPPEIGNLRNISALYVGINKLSGTLPREIGLLSKLEIFYSPSCSIEGPLPEEMAKLKALTKLDLSYNPLRCSIPKFIGELESLTILDLVFAQLNGSVPAELGKCKNLRSVMLSFNSLSGSLPEELSELPMLTFSAEKNQLHGPLPSWLGKWSNIDSLLLSANRFSGVIPPELGNCSVMEHLSLSSNLLTGPIPEELCNAASLLEVDLDDNFLSGTVEKVFVKCKNLTQLVLMNNRIVGSIPEYLSELSLMVLDLDSNNFSGKIPSGLWNSLALMEFSAANNRLEGSLPVEIGNAIMLERLVLSNNRLTGTIPKEIGRLSNLSVLNLNGNMLQGSIPNELGGCTSLTTLDLGNNQLNGSIPEKLVELSQLQCLVLSHNNLSGSIPGKKSSYFRQRSIPDLSFVQHLGVFDLSHNRLSGPIPDELGFCVVVVNLLVSNNMLSGSIPKSLSRLTNLTTLDLSGNLLSGSIPPELGGVLKLQGLYLGQNQLSGTIPQSLGKLSNLVKLNLTGNKLSGPIPVSFENMKGFTHLDLSSNELSGELPSSLSGVQSLVGIYVQNNRLSGQVGELFSNSMTWRIETVNLSDNCFTGNLPRSLGNLSCLTNLDLHGNMLTGDIPLDLGYLMQLEYFDVSGNKLSGRIPDKLCGLVNLIYLDVSRNRLEGPIPSNGICLNLPIVRVAGNRNLCGQMLGINCQDKSIGRSVLYNTWRLAAIAFTILLLTLSIAFVLHKWITRRQNNPEELKERKLNSYVDHNLYFLSSSRSKEPLSINVAMFEQPLLKLTLVDILEATDNFSKTNIIGDGGFGTVYKATLPNGKTVAVKKLSEAKTQGHREFMAEMETLGKVKHQNLVELLGYCSIGEEKLLVYEYMVNGSLDLWLRNRTGALEILDWNKRYKIATDAARGLAFLHHGFIPHIIHRDVKASNILLNEDFEPKVADFGLARLISACETHITTDIAGTFGYIPPEYGQSGRSTTRGDVYSFGVILLELVTGKEPTGPDFKEIEGGNLVGWVCQKIKKGQAADVLDPSVLDADSKQMMLQTLQIACVCISENPANRPTMLQVHKFLKGMKEE